MWVLLFTASLASASEVASDDLVYRALSVRHPEPLCAEIESMTPTPVATLLRMVDEASQPPWVPMRAAGCLLLRHPLDIRERLDAWVTDPHLQGLGILVVSRLDALPIEIAREVARKALSEGPDPEGTRERLRRLQTPELRALGEAP